MKKGRKKSLSSPNLWAPVDTRRKLATLEPMAVLFQIRVESHVAQNFKHAAKLRGKTPHAYLRQVVEKAAASPESRSLKNHRKLTEGLKLNRLHYDLVAKLRDDDSE